MEAQDAYKLIYQAACGPAHAVTDRTVALNWLKTEVLNLNEPYPEPFFDPISPDGSLARVHLAPYLAAGGSMEDLVDTFIATSQALLPDYSKLEGYLEDSLPIFPDLATLVKLLKPKGYPALHHSSTYRAAYKPAYRVVLIEFL